jgi:hypothetical protein
MAFCESRDGDDTENPARILAMELLNIPMKGYTISISQRSEHP